MRLLVYITIALVLALLVELGIQKIAEANRARIDRIERVELRLDHVEEGLYVIEGQR